MGGLDHVAWKDGAVDKENVVAFSRKQHGRRRARATRSDNDRVVFHGLSSRIRVVGGGAIMI